MKQGISLALAIIVLTFMVAATTSCTKTIVDHRTTLVTDTIIDSIPGARSLLVVTQDPQMQQNQTIVPGGYGQVAQYLIANNSNIDSVTINVVNVRMITSLGNILTNLSVNTQGVNTEIDQVDTNTAFTFNITLAPHEHRSVYVNLQADKKDTGSIQTALRVAATWSSKKDTIDYVNGQLVQLLVPVITNISVFLPNTSYPQFIPSGNLGAGDAWQITYLITTTGNGQFNVSDLGFSVAGANTASSIQCNSGTFPFVNGIATATNLDYYIYGYGKIFYLTVKVSCPPVGVDGVTSGSASQIILTHVRYNNGTTDRDIYPNASSTTMTLTTSAPRVSVYTPQNKLTVGWVEAMDFYMTADAKGDISSNSVPIEVYMYGVTLSTGTNVIVKDAAGNSINATISSFSNDGKAIIIFKDAGGYRIAAGSTTQFKVFLNVQSITDPNALLGTALVNSADFSWTDISGGATVPYTGGDRVVLYPGDQYAFIRQ